MAPNGKSLEELVDLAVAGNKEALEKVVLSIQDYVFNLAVRFYGNLPDAEDACQEILVKIITNLSKFEGRSAFRTWVYRVAVNYLLNAKKTEYETLTFEEGKQHLKEGLTYTAYGAADSALLEEEVKINCTISMLVCLSRPLRLAYLIGEILEYNSTEASQILDIEAATFRKRLSMARHRIKAFMNGNCGIYNPKNPCRCKKQIRYSIAVGWFDPKQPTFSNLKIQQAKNEIDQFMDEVAIFHSQPIYKTPQVVFQEIKGLMDMGKCFIFK